MSIQLKMGFIIEPNCCVKMVSSKLDQSAEMTRKLSTFGFNSLEIAVFIVMGTKRPYVTISTKSKNEGRQVENCRVCRKFSSTSLNGRFPSKVILDYLKAFEKFQFEKLAFLFKDSFFGNKISSPHTS